jgi:hypothetical protein
MDTFYGNGEGGATTFEIKKQKQKNNLRLNILDEGYSLNNENIA